MKKRMVIICMILLLAMAMLFAAKGKLSAGQNSGQTAQTASAAEFENETGTDEEQWGDVIEDLDGLLDSLG